MNFQIKSIIVILFLLSGISAVAAFETMSVGEVQERVITSREVMQSLHLEGALFDAKPPKPFNKETYASRVKGVMLEWVVYLEADSFNAVEVSAGELSISIAKVKKKLDGVPEWRELETTEEELKSLVARKLRAKDFIQFKAKSSLVPVTTEEARQYYMSNRSRFGDVPFEKIETSIKTYLKKSQLETRLKSWFDVLFSKYKVKNHLR